VLIGHVRIKFGVILPFVLSFFLILQIIGNVGS